MNLPRDEPLVMVTLAAAPTTASRCSAARASIRTESMMLVLPTVSASRSGRKPVVTTISSTVCCAAAGWNEPGPASPSMANVNIETEL